MLVPNTSAQAIFADSPMGVKAVFAANE